MDYANTISTKNELDDTSMFSDQPMTFKSTKRLGSIFMCPYCKKTVAVEDAVVEESSYDPVICKRCGHRWSNCTDKPLKCPSCGSLKWDEEVPVTECKQCGYAWQRRSKGEPLKCPRCQSRFWNRAERTPATRATVEKSIPEESKGLITEGYLSGKGMFDIAAEYSIPLLDVVYLFKINGWAPSKGAVDYRSHRGNAD